MNVAIRNGLVFNSSKCLIKERSVSFFGLIYGIDGINPDPDRIRDLQDIPPPRDKKELQQFLGLMTFLSPFIRNLSEKDSILRDLLKEDSMFMWELHHQSCFDGLKHLVTTRSCLQYFNVAKTAILQTDASLLGLGAALLQENESGVVQPVAYASKSLSGAEKRYACIERELLAIVFGTQKFHTYLYGRKFRVIPDHLPLVAIVQKGLINSPPRIQRMFLKLKGYDMEVEYQPGKEIVLADTLSRLPSVHNKETIDRDVRVYFVRFSDERIKELRNKTKDDQVLRTLSETIVTGWPKTIKELPTSIRSYWAFRDELSVEDGILLKGTRVIIPESMQPFILDRLHYGHLGIDNTRLRAKDSVYWININRDIETTVKSCHICQEHQPAQQHEMLLPHEIPSRPWKVVGTDMFFFNDAEAHHCGLLLEFFDCSQNAEAMSELKCCFSNETDLQRDRCAFSSRVRQRSTFCQRKLPRPVKEDVIPACDVFAEISTLKRLRRTPNSNSETRHEESETEWARSRHGAAVSTNNAD